jgi:hypothetical protein
MRQVTLRQDKDTESVSYPNDGIGRSILLSDLSALKSSVINRSDCILVPTENGWILHVPLAGKAKGVIP